MRQKWFVSFIIITVLLLLGACHQPTPTPVPPALPAHEELYVHIVPATVVVRSGESIELEVKVEPGQNGLSGGEINVSFDSSLVHVTNMNPGSLLGSNPLVGIEEIDNQAGKIRFALARVGETPVPTPPGVFATIELKPVVSIQGQVCQLTRVGFCNEHFEDIGEIVLSEPPERPTPRPGMAMVLKANLSEVEPQERSSMVESTIKIIEERLSAYRVKQATVLRQGPDQIVVEVPGVEITDEVVRLITEQGQLSFREQVNGNWVIARATGSDGREKELTGHYLKPNAQVVVLDPRIDKAQVAFEWNEEGAVLFEQVTKRNLKKPLGIFLDDKLICAPTIVEVIRAGGIIVGLTTDEADVIAVQLNSGELPVPLDIISLP